MNENIPQHSPSGLRHGIHITQRSIAGCWLLLFYLISIWMVLGTLSSHQFQQKIRQENFAAEIADKNRGNTDSKKDTPLSRQISAATVRQLLEYRESLNESVQNLKQGGQLIRQLRNELNKAAVDLDREENQVEELRLRFEIQLRRLDYTDIPVDFSAPPAPALQELMIRSPELETFRTAYISAIQEKKRLEKEFERLTLELEDAKNENIQERSRLDRIQAQQEKMLSWYEGLQPHLNDLLYMRRIGLDFLATMPEQMLTLILTLSMGALGSVLYLTRTFFDPKRIDMPFSWYLFRPFLGMVTAIAVFILAKSGQIVISDGSFQEGLSANLNPFFISFLAIVSGILSEQAYQRIHRSGEAFFRVETAEKWRWAFHLSAELEAQGKTVENLAQRLDVSENLVQRWVEEREMVPESEQRVIAAWLGKESRDIFSDQAPVGRNAPKEAD